MIAKMIPIRAIEEMNKKNDFLQDTGETTSKRNALGGPEQFGLVMVI